MRSDLLKTKKYYSKKVESNKSKIKELQNTIVEVGKDAKRSGNVYAMLDLMVELACDMGESKAYLRETEHEIALSEGLIDAF